MLLRPEQIVLGPAGDSGDSGGPATPAAGGVEAKVRDVSYFGHDAAVRLELVGGPRCVARIAGHPSPSPAPPSASPSPAKPSPTPPNDPQMRPRSRARSTAAARVGTSSLR